MAVRGSGDPGVGPARVSSDDLVHTDAVGSAFVTASFGLTPQEDFVHGVKYDNARLSFTASGTQLLQGWAVLLVGSAVTLGLMAISLAGEIEIEGLTSIGGTAGVALGAIGFIVVVVLGLALIRPKVTADSSGLELRWLGRRRLLDWSAVADIIAVNTRPQRVSGYVSPASVGLRVRAIGSWSIGLAVLHDGSQIQLPSFVSAAKGDGLTLTAATPSELKATALRRFMSEVAGVQPISGGAITQPPRSRLYPLGMWRSASGRPHPANDSGPEPPQSKR